MNSLIYLDHAATTPVRPEVAEAWSAALHGGNPSSVHARGREARAAVEQARERVAAALGARRTEVVFTSGGTEANNLAVLGRWRAGRMVGARGVACSAIEHSSVLEAAQAAAYEGADLVLLGVDAEGRVDPGSVSDALAAAPTVVSVMLGNNEVGTLQDLERIGAVCRDANVVLHSDAVQAFGKIEVRVDRLPVDLLTISGHKIGGPMGVAALFVRDGVEVAPLVHGGGQQRGVRPGTENVAGIVSFALAVELAAREAGETGARMAALRDRLEAALRERVPGIDVNAGGARRLPHIASLRVPDVDREVLIMALDLDGIAASAGSACHSGSVEPSHVLAAMGRDEPGTASIRLSLGRSTTEREIDEVVPRFAAVVERARALAEV